MRLIFILAGGALYVGLAVWAFGGIEPFFSHPPLVALVVVMIALCVAAYLTKGGNMSAGVREDRGNRWVLVVFTIVGLLDGYLPAWTDRHDFSTLDGDTLRWFGVALVAAGGTLRLWPVFALGRRFSGLVAIQEGHTLVTTGIYGKIRHPSYLGLLLGALGWGLAFRSSIGVLLALSFLPVVVVRIKAEEALLLSQFGAEYDGYRARTSRLIPGLY